MITLKSAGEFLAAPKLPAAFLRIIASVRRVFSFTQERANRLARFVRIVNAYRLGKPVRDIEAQYGCSRSTVLRYARVAGLDRRPKGFQPDVKQATIAALQAGKPLAEISALLGVSEAYASKVAKANGLNRYKRLAA